MRAVPATTSARARPAPLRRVRAGPSATPRAGAGASSLRHQREATLDANRSRRAPRASREALDAAPRRAAQGARVVWIDRVRRRDARTVRPLHQVDERRARSSPVQAQQRLEVSASARG